MATQAGYSSDSAVVQTLALYHILDLRFVQQLREQLLQSLHRPGDIRIDSGSVQRMSTAAVQVICAFLKEAKAMGKSVVMPDPSEAFVSAFDAMGLDSFLTTSGYVSSK